MSTAALNPLVTKIRGMHPGAYDDMDDAALTKRVLAKYPQYSDLAAGAPPQAPDFAGQNAAAMGAIQGDQTRASIAGIPGAGANANPGTPGYMAAVGAPVGAAALAMGGSTVLPFLAQQFRAHPIAGPILAQEAISQARKLPYVGSHIPALAEMVPWLLGGKGKPAEGEPPPDPGVLHGPQTPSPQLLQSRALAEPGATPKPPPSAALGNIPFLRSAEAPPMPSPERIAASSNNPSVVASHGDAVAQARATLGPNASLSDLMKRADEIQRGVTSPNLPFLPKTNTTGLKPALERGLGNEPTIIKPGVSMRNQATAPEQPTADLPPGHTPVDSSALRSYKYDPEAREMHAQYKGATGVHVFGDVSPEEAQDFEQNPSKGKAMQTIKNGSHPLVAKISPEGKRTSTKPADDVNDQGQTLGFDWRPPEDIGNKVRGRSQ
jgi:hypothetical protein